MGSAENKLSATAHAVSPANRAVTPTAVLVGRENDEQLRKRS